MNSRALTRVFPLSPYLLAVLSVGATRIFSQHTLSEVLAVLAFLCGLALWRADRSTDRLILIGAALGISGLALKGIFVWLGVGAEGHDVTTHENTYRDWETDRKSTRLNSSHSAKSRMPSSA